MSGVNTSLKTSKHEAGPNKAVSLHQKLEEARRRRAEVLASGPPANAPKAALKVVGIATVEPTAKAQPKPKTQPEPVTPVSATSEAPVEVTEVTLDPETVQPFQANPDTPSELEPDPTSSDPAMAARILRGLMVMLAILLAGAAYQLWQSRLAPAPSYILLNSGIAPPVSIGYNPRLTVAQDRATVRLFPSRLSGQWPDNAPTAMVAPVHPDTAAPTVFAADITLPPPPRPSSVTTRPADG